MIVCWGRRLLLGRVTIAFLVSLWSAAPLAAQCFVENPGGSSANVFRPSDASVPPARFSPLAEANRALPEWLCITAGYRARAEGYNAGNFQVGNSASYLLTRFRFGVLIKPWAGVKLFAELQDATVFWKKPPLAPPYQCTWDLRRAFVDLGDLERSPVAFRVGRQDLSFGYGRLVGTSYWRNASRGYDAAMLVARWRWLRVNVFAASPVIALDNGLSHHMQGNNLHGVYSGLRDVIPHSVIEPYVFWRLSPNIKTEQGVVSKLNEKVVGVRWAGTASRFDYDTELAGETGSIGTDVIRAWAWSGILGYTFESSRLRPRLFAKYDFASGDRNPADGRHGTFDQLYPNIHDHHGLADQVAWQNLKSVRTGARFSVRPNWMLAGMYNEYWLASATDAFYNSSGGVVARDPKGLSGSHIGREFDAETSYRFDRNFELGLGFGYFRSGGFLTRAHRAASYRYPYFMLNYNFS